MTETLLSILSVIGILIGIVFLGAILLISIISIIWLFRGLIDTFKGENKNGNKKER